MNTLKKIVAVIVTYYPQTTQLVRLLNALDRQVESIVIVDNGSHESLDALIRGRTKRHEELVPLGANFGIAKAQNIGINRAREKEADYVLLFDQDSEPAPDMVEQLLAVAEAKASQGIQLACVGPRYMDNRQDNPPPFIRVKGLRVERQLCTCGDAVSEVDYLISSGCLIPMAALNKIGYMREDLFIDYVDIEWGLRAKHFGYQSFGVCAAIMRHDLGDQPIEFFGRKIPVHNPLRHYYHFRNAVWLYRQEWLPLHWKLADGWRLLLKYGFYTLFAKPRLQHLRMMTLGLWHGLGNRMGIFNNR